MQKVVILYLLQYTTISLVLIYYSIQILFTGSDTLHTRMANRIEELCIRQDVDGIFVSIPSDTVLSAIQQCLDLGIPTISINAGADKSQELNLSHHIGQLEFNAGKGAGKFLIKSGITSGSCANHAEGVAVVEERCAGFAAALEEAGVPYIGQAYVPDDNEPIYIENVENVVNQDGDWSGVGFLAAGGPQHVSAASLQKRYPGVKIGAFDTSSSLYEALDAGTVEFGMDQEPYLQGYMPVVLLTMAATTGQGVSNRVIESGPAFVTESPSKERQECEEVFYKTCDEAEAAVEEVGQQQNNTGLIVGICVLAVVVVAMGGFFVYRLRALNKHVAELKAQGHSVRRVSMSQRALSIVKPVNQVVEADDTAPAQPDA
mmetsp:Transcript_23820/g.51472  ORF Transcript_23820/g.51472 Transcript_23820/m.51472 type:complete len:374 (+) Transcript_23820:1363-2484(+)